MRIKAKMHLKIIINDKFDDDDTKTKIRKALAMKIKKIPTMGEGWKCEGGIMLKLTWVTRPVKP